MPVRPPLPVISVGAVAVLMGLALGIGLGASEDRPQSERGGAGADSGADPGRRQIGGDLPPMDFEGQASSAAASKSSKKSTTATTTPSSVATNTPEADGPRHTEEATSEVRLTSTPELPMLPSVPTATVGSVSFSSSSVPASS